MQLLIVDINQSVSSICRVFWYRYVGYKVPKREIGSNTNNVHKADTLNEPLNTQHVQVELQDVTQLKEVLFYCFNPGTLPKSGNYRDNYYYHYYCKVQKKKKGKKSGNGSIFDLRVFLVQHHMPWLGRRSRILAFHCVLCNTSKAKTHYPPNFISFNLRVSHIFSESMLVMRTSWCTLCYFWIKSVWKPRNVF